MFASGARGDLSWDALCSKEVRLTFTVCASSRQAKAAGRIAERLALRLERRRSKLYANAGETSPLQDPRSSEPSCRTSIGIRSPL